MSKLQQKFLQGGFPITAEMAPPKGYDFNEALETAALLKDRVDGVNVTDMQSACLKASSLGLCIALKQSGVEPILQMTGRDRSRMAIQAEFLSAAAFGIDTMLALTGDHPVVGDCKSSKPVFDLDSVGILKMLTNMEETSKDCGGNDLTSTPKFFKGAAVTPVYEPLFLQINKLKKKIDAGAEFVQTQGLFTVEALEIFMNEVERNNLKVKVMAGIIPLKAAGMARYMNENIPGISVPDAMIERLQAAAEEGKARGVKGLPMEAGMDMAADLIREIKARNLCHGVHIMAIGAERNVPKILDRAEL